MKKITYNLLELFKISIAVLLFFPFLTNNLLADNNFILSINGTYDFDGDGLSEFLSIEKLDSSARYAQSVTYYEIDSLGAHTKIWEFKGSLPIKDSRIVDMDGNDSPEVIVLTTGGTPDTQQENNFWIDWFTWEAGSFSLSPKARWRDGDGKGSHKPSSITLLDMDNDGKDEIAMAIGSPRREIVLLNLNSTTDPPEFESSRFLTSPSIYSGYGQIFVSTVDYNQDGYPDLMAISRELSTLKVQIFTNEGGSLVEGPAYQKDITPLSQDLSGLVSSGINTVDINQDGADEILLPFLTGAAISLNVEDGDLSIRPVNIEVAALFALPESGLDNSVINEILLDRAELGITGMKARKLRLETIEVQPPAETEETAGAEPTIPARRVQRLELTSVELVAEEEALVDTLETDAVDREPPILDVEVMETIKPQAETEATPDLAAEEPPETEPGQPRKVKKLQLTTLEKDEETTPPTETIEPAEPVSIPPEVEISDTARVGEKYSYTLEGGEGRSLHAFRPKTLPYGAFFDPLNRAVTWTPTETQIGAHKLAYEVEYKITGERVSVQEVEGESVQVLTTTETDTVEFYILVQSAVEP